MTRWIESLDSTTSSSATMFGCRRQRMMRTSPAKNFMSSALLGIVFTATGSPERRLTASYTTDDAPRPISRRSSYKSSSRAHGAVPVLCGAGWLRNRIPLFRFFSPEDIVPSVTKKKGIVLL